MGGDPHAFAGNRREVGGHEINGDAPHPPASRSAQASGSENRASAITRMSAANDLHSGGPTIPVGPVATMVLFRNSTMSSFGSLEDSN